jgi:hypothetical protein
VRPETARLYEAVVAMVVAYSPGSMLTCECSGDAATGTRFNGRSPRWKGEGLGAYRHSPLSRQTSP